MAGLDRKFYAGNAAFGRLGMRWFSPQIMREPHVHGHIEMNWLAEGSMTYVIDGREIVVPAQQLVMFWAGIPHQLARLEADTANRMSLCNIYVPFDQFLYLAHVAELRETMIGGGMICLNSDQTDAAALRRWYADYRSRNPERIDIMRMEIYALLRRASIMGWEEMLPPWRSSTPVQAGRSHAPVRHVIDMLSYILENLAEPLGNDQIARAVGLHPNYALNLFTSVMREPFRKFITRMRLLHARALLFEIDMPIASVAYQAGFSSLSQFYLYFKRSYGVTPQQLRRSYASGDAGVED